MTIIEAINRLDALKNNVYTQTEKVAWLSELDGKVKRLIIDAHEGGDELSFSGYGEETPMDTVLLVPAPFDEIYLRWLEAQIDYHNGEMDRYNNGIVLYNALYDAYAKDYTRHHMPVSRGRRFMF